MVEGMPMPKMISSEDMLKNTGPIFDAFSYHFYTTLSERCVGKAGLSQDKVLTPAYLDRNPAAEAFYAKLRDTYLPGKPIWNTETGEAGCGGNRWASTFVDGFRFVDQLGILAQKNVQTVIVNTLAASEYGLLDPTTLEPRPDYWAALIWKRTMGVRVLNPGVAPTPEMHVYAHCAKDSKGGVALVVINLDPSKEQTLQIPLDGERYTLSSSALASKTVSLNGVELRDGADGTLPRTTGVRFKAGNVKFAPTTITFITLPGAENTSCM
jgi:heparanase 1